MIDEACRLSDRQTGRQIDVRTVVGLIYTPGKAAAVLKKALRVNPTRDESEVLRYKDRE